MLKKWLCGQRSRSSRLLLALAGCQLCWMPGLDGLSLSAPCKSRISTSFAAGVSWRTRGGGKQIAVAKAYYGTYDLNNLRANEGNPNHPDFWKKQGLDDRPDNWEEFVDQARSKGILEHKVNTAAARSPEQKKAAGRDTRKVEHATKQSLGGTAKLHRNGSRAKKTDLADSDQDYKIETDSTVTAEDRQRFILELEKPFPGKVKITSKGIVRAEGESGQLCIIFQKADFYDKDGQEIVCSGTADFKGNPAGQKAVRAVKLALQERELQMRGYEVECAVRKAQELNPEADWYDLTKATLCRMGLPCSSKMVVAF